jgi:hypothetical protein
MNFQVVGGPSDKRLRHDEVSGYQPVSRIGEVVINAFVDPNEFHQLGTVNMTFTELGLTGGGTEREAQPHFHEWATVLPGMICISRSNRTDLYRNNLSAETSVPCVASAKGIIVGNRPNNTPNTNWNYESDFFFAGVARSKSIREYDDGLGPSTDEYFTLSIGGMATVLNTSSDPITPGAAVSWSAGTDPSSKKVSIIANKNAGPRRVGITGGNDFSGPRVIGRALSFAKPGDSLDVCWRTSTLTCQTPVIHKSDWQAHLFACVVCLVWKQILLKQ